MSVKIDRIASNLVKEISYILMTEVKDPDVKFVTVTDCKVTSDLSYAKVYVTVSNQDRIDETMKALKNAYIGRKLKKRDFRKLWIQRINAAARMNGISYSRLMNGLKLAGVEVNRKMLSEMAIQDPQGFAKLVEVAKAKLA